MPFLRQFFRGFRSKWLDWVKQFAVIYGTKFNEHAKHKESIVWSTETPKFGGYSFYFRVISTAMNTNKQSYSDKLLCVREGKLDRYQSAENINL